MPKAPIIIERCNCNISDGRQIIFDRNGLTKLTCNCGKRFIRYIGIEYFEEWRREW